MKLKRAHWEPTEHSAVSSEHFREEDLTNRFSEDLDRRLKRDEISVSVFPTKHIHSVSNDKTAERPESQLGEIFVNNVQSACRSTRAEIYFG